MRLAKTYQGGGSRRLHCVHLQHDCYVILFLSRKLQIDPTKTSTSNDNKFRGPPTTNQPKSKPVHLQSRTLKAIIWHEAADKFPYTGVKYSGGKRSRNEA
jgi:hypothetical protein